MFKKISHSFPQICEMEILPSVFSPQCFNPLLRSEDNTFYKPIKALHSLLPPQTTILLKENKANSYTSASPE